jgi:tRNA-2-methylthio-N6-dimethylallyladenosine synthase
MKPPEKRFFVETFGCQMNVNDSEKVAGLLVQDGYVPAASAEQADVVFINTCAVREKAAEKVYSAVGRLKRLRSRNPALKIAVGGCVAQLEGEAILERAPAIDLLVGTHTFGRIPELLRALDSSSAGTKQGRLKRAVDLDRKADSFGIPPAVVAHSNPVRAFVTVMEGCNHVCSFCVVPRTRGPEVCRSPGSIVAEVESLVARGVREVMLLGQTVNAYRHGTVDFAQLLALVDAVPGLLRLRFTTSHPEHVGPELARAMGTLSTVCPHVHLPVQSGSDRVLEAMRRGYTREAYRATVALLRSEVPDLALTTDIIVGYPGETEAEFEETVALVDEMAFEGAFVFTYSPRPGTTALRLADDVVESEKLRRLQLLNQRQQRWQGVRNQGRVGSVVEVLVDGTGAPDHLSGRSLDFRLVHMSGPATFLGQILNVEITGSGSNALSGRVTEPPSGLLTGSSAVPIL